MAEQNLNIYQKLAKIRKQVEVIQRNKKGYGYTYVSEDEILAKISGFMDKYSLSLIPSVIHSSAVVTPYHTKKTKSTNKGEIYEENVNEVLVSADMVFTWVNNENPNERVDVPWILVGHQSDGSQSFGSGLSYAMRYFLLTVCVLPESMRYMITVPIIMRFTEDLHLSFPTFLKCSISASCVWRRRWHLPQEEPR